MQLRQHDYLPVLFDFDKPASKDLTGTVQTLANMARFIITIFTDPSSVPRTSWLWWSRLPGPGPAGAFGRTGMSTPCSGT